MRVDPVSVFRRVGTALGRTARHGVENATSNGNADTVSEPTQSPSPNVGRYTFMGDLNRGGFNVPSQGC